MNGWASAGVWLLWVAAAVSLIGLPNEPVTVGRRLEPFVAGLTGRTALRGRTRLVDGWFVWALRRFMFTRSSETALQLRLQRAGVVQTPLTFRSTQLVAGFSAFVLAAALTVGFRLPTVAVFALLVGLPAMAVWIVEHALTVALRRRKELVVRELPLIIEQLAELVKNGVGIGEACAHVAVHTQSVVARDLGRVAREMAHGVRDEVALLAFAERHDVAAIHRIVAVLDAHRYATDLGSLLAEEVRELRLAAHRDLLALMQQREQQVWIPVTVATLVPGVLLLGVPFVYTRGVVLG